MNFSTHLKTLFAFCLICLSQVVWAQNCTVNAGVAQNICANETLTLRGQSSGSYQSPTTFTWTQVSGPSSVIVNPNMLTTTVTGLTSGTYVYRISTTCADGTKPTNDVTVTVAPITIANAGLDQTLCPGSGSLSANAPGSGTGSWSVIWPNNAMVSLANTSSPTTSFTVPADTAGRSTLRWTISQTTNGKSCSSSSDIVITNRGGVQPVNAGPDKVLSPCFSNSTSTVLTGSYAGKGFGGQDGTWSLVNGPNTPTITRMTSTMENFYFPQVATISNLVAGTYTFRWTASGACVNGSDDVQVIVPSSGAGLTTANAGNAQTFCDNRTTAVLAGNNPTFSGEQVQWTLISGPAGAVITSPTAPTTTITNLDGQSAYIFQYTITNTNTGCSSTSTVAIGYTAPPTITVNGGVNVIQLQCGVSAHSIPYTFTGGNATWYRVISGPNTSSSVMSGSSPQPINNVFTSPGTYIVRFTRVGTGCNDASADITVIASRTPTASNAGTSQLLACNVTNTKLAGNIPTVGSGSWSQVSGPNTAIIDNPSVNNSAISGLTNGLYTFKWIISGGLGCTPSESTVNVAVASTAPTPANAGADRSVCYGSPMILNGNTPALNETGTWTVSPAAGVSFSNPNATTATVTGLAANTIYTFTWTITNACGSSADEVLVSTSNILGPDQANAGSIRCLQPSVNSIPALSGNNPTVVDATGSWTQDSGPTTAVFSNAGSGTSAVSGLGVGTYQFRWTISKVGCDPSTSTVNVVIGADATTANAGPGQSICAVNTTLAGNNPSVGSGTWTQIAGPGGATIVSPSQYNTAVNSLVAGSYTFRWTISNNGCGTNSSDVTIAVSAAPSTADAGSDKLCLQGIGTNTQVTLSAVAPISGIGAWSFVSGPTTPTINSVTSASTYVTKLENGTYTFRWSVTGGPACAVNSNLMRVSVNNTLPTTAGSLGSVCNQNTATLKYDGFTGSWTQVGSTPSIATITKLGTVTSQAFATGLVPGNYTFRFDPDAVGLCTAVSGRNMTLTILPPPSAANAGTNQNLCNASTISLAATAPTSGTGTWTVTSAPVGNGGSFSNAGQASASYSPASIGNYIFTYTISTGTNCSSASQVTVVNTAAPSTANAGPDQSIATCATNATLAAQTPTSGTGIWTQVNGPNTASITNPALPNTTVTGLISGNYTFQWTVTNGSCTASTDLMEIHNCSEALPVKFAAVSSSRQANGNLVNWTVEQEVNVEKYDVEKSINGRSFVLIGEVAYKKTASPQNRYSYVDTDPGDQTVFYRIRQVDFDGSLTYSPVVSVSARNANALAPLVIYPNPVGDNTVVRFAVSRTQSAVLTITDAQGRKIAVRSVVVHKGQNIIPAPFTGKLAQGAYLLSLFADGTTQTVRFIR